jgi:hypothetical protein
MKGRLSTCEADTGDISDLLRILEHTLQEINFKKNCVVTIESFFRSEAIAAMKITNIGQLDTHSLWTIIISRSGIAGHIIRHR